MADLYADWEDRSAEKSTRVAERDMPLALRCDQCRVDPLAISTEQFRRRLTTAAGKHNEILPGHAARVERRQR